MARRGGLNAGRPCGRKGTAGRHPKATAAIPARIIGLASALGVGRPSEASAIILANFASSLSPSQRAP